MVSVFFICVVFLCLLLMWLCQPRLLYTQPINVICGFLGELCCNKFTTMRPEAMHVREVAEGKKKKMMLSQL